MSLEATHILAHSWWNPSENRRGILPKSIVAAVQSLHDKIDDVRNGLLLRTDLATAFDHGHFSLQLQDGHYRVVSLSREFENLDGLILDENRRVKSDGYSWWQSKFPQPELVAFHLKQSVFKHLVACGSHDSDGEFDDDDCCSVVRGEALDEEGNHVSEMETPCRNKVKRTEDTGSASDTRGRAATTGSVPTTWLAAARSCTGVQSSPAQP
jgi:hypothetical protein